jgi:hypothetical protein
MPLAQFLDFANLAGRDTEGGKAAPVAVFDTGHQSDMGFHRSRANCNCNAVTSSSCARP